MASFYVLFNYRRDGQQRQGWMITPTEHDLDTPLGLLNFINALIAEYGEDTAVQYWRRLAIPDEIRPIDRVIEFLNATIEDQPGSITCGEFHLVRRAVLAAGLGRIRGVWVDGAFTGKFEEEP